MAFAHIASTSKGAVGGAAVTTDAINTTGATLLILVIGWYGGLSDPSVSDSKGNTWTPLTSQSGASDPPEVRIYYSVPTSVGSGHTFTNSQADYSTVCAAAFSGGHATPFDQEDGSTGDGITSHLAGSVTPSEDNELIIVGNSLRGIGEFGNVSINGGVTIATQQPGVAASSLSGALAYLIQTAATNVSPTWSWTTTDNSVSVIATFKAAAVAAGNPWYAYAQM